MSITIDLPQELAGELSAEAARLGLPLSAYAERILTARTLLPNRPTTGAELVKYWEAEGLLGTRPEIQDSQAHARELRQRAERRERA